MNDNESSSIDHLISYTISDLNGSGDSNLIENFFKIFSLNEKTNLSSIYLTSIGNTFVIGSVLFCCLMIICFYLDTSLRNQIFYVFDNCTIDDYVFEYIVKIRFALSPEFSSYTDLVIEFYNNKFKPLSKFIVNGSYLENGLNIGTKLCPGMKITSLYLFKQNSLNNLEYCRAYLNTNDATIFMHLYSIEIGDNREVQVFFFNHNINKSNPNAIQLSLNVEEPITSKYIGPIVETSYLQVSLFIYYFFLLTFFFNRLTPTQEKLPIFKGFNLNRNLLINSTLAALISGVFYLIFRDLIHFKYTSSNGKSKWLRLERGFLIFLSIIFLFLSLSSILTTFKDPKRSEVYFDLVIYSNLTLIYWIPIALLYFYLFSTSNYHLGRIWMKGFFEQAEKSRRFQKNKRGTYKTTDDDDSFNEDSSRNSEMPRLSKKIQQKLISMQPRKLLQPGITYSQGNLVPVYDAGIKQQYPFNITSPVTYITDPKFAVQMAAAQLLSVQPYELNNTDLQLNIVTPYRSIQDKVSKAPINKYEKFARDRLMKQMKSSFNVKSLETDASEQKLTNLNITGKATSKTSIGSTGSDYYAAMFKDGKVPKVGSISQYGSLLRQ